jgi:ribonuclease BN (tRNA processing enzyme)
MGTFADSDTAVLAGPASVARKGKPVSMPIEVTLLPTCGGTMSQSQPLTSFLLNEGVALDAGSLGFSLTGEQFARIGHLFLTHAHMDHVASLPIALAESFSHLKRPLRIYATDHVLKMVRTHVLNGEIWPDFAHFNVPGTNQPAVEYITIEPRRPVKIDGLTLTPVPVHHEVPCVGYIVESNDSAVAFTSDTGPTEEIWTIANRTKNLKAVCIDCSFPDEKEELAILSGHLTPNLITHEARKLKVPGCEFLCVHIKPDTRERVIEEIRSHGKPLSVLEIGKTYRF